MMRVPFFHYTCLDGLPSILKDGRLVSRHWLAKNGKEFTDISIDPSQRTREGLGLLEYIPLFPGFYTLFRGYELNGHLMRSYDDPKVQNKSFYGSLNKVLQVTMGPRYDSVIILMVNDELIYNFADHDKVRFFTDIAVKEEAEELPITNRVALQDCLTKGIDDSNIWGEIDVLDDGKVSIACTSDIEAIIVDSDEVKDNLMTTLSTCNTLGGRRPLIFISKLPRNDPGEDDFDL